MTGCGGVDVILQSGADNDTGKFLSQTGDGVEGMGINSASLSS